MKKTMVSFLSFIIMLSLLLSACSSVKPTATPEPASKEAFNPLVSATGVVVPAKWATLAMPTGGLLADVLIQEGEMVTAGQVLTRIDGQEAAQAMLASAKSDLASAQQALDGLKQNAPLLAAQAQQDIAAAQLTVINAERGMVRFDQQA